MSGFYILKYPLNIYAIYTILIFMTNMILIG